MRQYIAIFQKEWLESRRTYKLYLLLIFFLVSGMMSPLIAKLTPDIMTSFLPKGTLVSLPNPSALDSWAQFFKNITQTGLPLLILIYSGIVTTDLNKGTLVNLLTKGLSRPVVLLAKYSLLVLSWTINLALSSLMTWGYTAYLFPNIALSHLFFSLFCLWLFGLLLLALLLFSSVLIPNGYGHLALLGGTLILAFILNVIPKIEEKSPLRLVTSNLAIIQGKLSPSDLNNVIFISLILTIIFISGAIFFFRRHQIS